MTQQQKVGKNPSYKRRRSGYGQMVAEALKRVTLYLLGNKHTKLRLLGSQKTFWKKGGTQRAEWPAAAVRKRKGEGKRKIGDDFALEISNERPQELGPAGKKGKKVCWL